MQFSLAVLFTAASYILNANAAPVCGCIPVTTDTEEAAGHPLIVLRSNSPIHHLPISFRDAQLGIFNNNSLPFTGHITETGKMAIDTEGAVGAYVFLNDNDPELIGGLVAAPGIFSNETVNPVTDILIYDNSSAFTACPIGDEEYTIAFNSTCVGGLDIAILYA